MAKLFKKLLNERNSGAEDKNNGIKWFQNKMIMPIEDNTDEKSNIRV